MINTSSDDALTQAYNLIEAGKLDDAKAILKPILDADKDNPDAWWLYAHAVTDGETARIALNNVLRLDSEYPEAADLLKSLEEGSPSDRVLDSPNEPSFLPAVPASLPDLPELGGDSGSFGSSEEFDETTRSESIFKRPAFLIGVIAILLVVAIIIVVVRPFGGPAQSNTVAVEQPTLSTTTASNTTAVVPTLVPQNVTDSFAAVRSALASFTLVDDGITISPTSLGNTLVVSVCATAGRELRAALPQVMDALAKVNESYSNQAEAMAVRMTDCQTKADLLTIGAALSDAVAYSGGSLTEEDFQSRWKPVK